MLAFAHKHGESFDEYLKHSNGDASLFAQTDILFLGDITRSLQKETRTNES